MAAWNWIIVHSPEVRQKLIERRAQGWSLVRIAFELGLTRSTHIGEIQE